VRAIDAATGKPRGDGVTYTAPAAVAGAPTRFGPGRYLVPMTDGAAWLATLP
jgi:hypothetical protein